MRELFHPSPLCIIQSLFQPTHYDFVHGLGLPISLGVGRSGISVCDSEFATIFPEVLTIKLKIVVRDKSMRSSEARNNVFPNEFLSIHVPNVGQRFSFYPFGEIIGADYNVPLIPCCFKERIDNIKTPLSKRPGAEEGVEDSPRLVDIWGKSLALITRLCIFLGLSLQVRPPVPLGECPMRQRSSFHKFLHVVLQIGRAHV